VNPLSRFSNNAKFGLTLLLFCGAALCVSLWPGNSTRRLVLEYHDLMVGDNDDEAATEQAKEKIRELGARAVPQLMRMLQAEPSKLDKLMEKVAEWGNDRWGWEYNPRERLDREHGAALSAIPVLGTNAIAALPVLEKLFLHPDRTVTVNWALGAMGAPALPIFVAGLTNSAASVRCSAVVGLGSMKGDARSVYSALAPLFADPDTQVRSELGYAAGRTANSMADAVRDLAPLIHDSEAQVRRGAAHGLGMAARFRRADEPGMTAAAALVADCLDDPVKDVRYWAAWMMMHFKEAAMPHIPALVRLLDDTDQRVQGIATSTLGRLKLEPATVIPALAARLAATTGNTHTWTAVALRGYGDEIEKARPGLLGTLGALGKKEFEAQEEVRRKQERARQL
jgi:HEAT repeat protein